MDLIHKIQRISVYREVIKISRLDAGECLKKWSKQLPRRALLNIDPPYFTQGKDLYLSFYKPEDHAGLAQIIRRISLPWMLTYDDATEIRTLYEGLPIYRKSLIYSAQVKRRASELLVLSPSLHPPAVLLQSIAA
jgi:DNA adenine methylase